VLSPAAARSFLRVPIERLNDRVVDLRELWGSEVDVLLARLREAPDTARHLQILDAALTQRLGAGRPPDPVVLAALRLIKARRGVIPIHELLRELGVSERRLERLFRAWTGLSPKRMCRLAQVDAARVRLASPPELPCGVLAGELGFADQAHLIREFRKVTGTTPARYRREHAILSDALQPLDAEDPFAFWASAETIEARTESALAEWRRR
jgi:AraC-like DNA-binding protein